MSCNRYFVFCFVVSVLSTVFLPAVAIENYCSRNTYSTNGSYLRFTKETSHEEFAVTGRFKGLHCCAKGYSSIEWYKDGQPYPWPSTLSQLILYPESANQTVYTPSVSQDDGGNYTCLLKNETVVFVHTIHLTVYEKVPDDPKITYVSKDVEASPGKPLRLFCEAFVGKVDLPDAVNDVRWTKSLSNGSIDLDPRRHQHQVSREEDQTYGTYLTVEKVTKNDYGEYVCKVSKPGKSLDLHVYVTEKLDKVHVPPNPFPWKKTIIGALIVSLVMFTLLILTNNYGLPLRVRMKDSFGRLEESDGKINDVLLVYSSSDSALAVGVLLPVLDSKYGYKCETVELPENVSLWYTNLADAAERSRRILAVLSPSCLDNKWDSLSMHNALKQLSSLGPQVSCITLKELPVQAMETKNAQGETLSSLLRNITVIQWGKYHDDKFWLSLLLRLPPKRNQRAASQSTSQNSCPRLNDDCQERLNSAV